MTKITKRILLESFYIPDLFSHNTKEIDIDSFINKIVNIKQKYIDFAPLTLEYECGWDEPGSMEVYGMRMETDSEYEQRKIREETIRIQELKKQDKKKAAEEMKKLKIKIFEEKMNKVAQKHGVTPDQLKAIRKELLNK